MTTQISNVPHPGEIIREELEAREWSQRDLAFVLGIPEQSVGLLLGGKRGITADMARALGDAFDVPAEFFVNLQAAYDLTKARSPDPSVARKGKLQSSYPVREMIKRGWLVDSSADLIEQNMIRFFEVKTREQIPHIDHAAKKSHYDEVPPAQVAWLFRVRQLAREMALAVKYTEQRLRAAVEQLRALLTAPEEARHVPRILAECGVRFVVVESLSGSKIDGVCLWLDDRTPVIGMSLRFDRIDNFWFVLRHEIEHVLRGHGKVTPVIDVDLEGPNAGDGPTVREEERVANAAASDFCVPKADMESYIRRKQPYFSEREMIAFATRMKVHPGLVAGQIRHRTGRWTMFAKHLVKIRTAILSAAVVDGWGEVAPTNS